MKRLLLAALAALIPLLAFAGSVPLTWDNPTEYTDNTPIPATGPGSLTGSDINYGKCGSNNQALLPDPVPVVLNVPAPASSVTIPDLGAGKWCFRIRSVTTDQPSAYTSYINKTILAPIPKPPTNFTAPAGIAFMEIRQRDRYVMLPVGTVSADTPCDPNYAVVAAGATYYAVPRSSVAFYGSTQPEIVLAKCS